MPYAAPEWLQAVRHAAFIAFLVFGSLFALPAIALGLLLAQLCASHWDAAERWSGVWVTALMGTALYALLIWRLHPYPIQLLNLWYALHTHQFLAAGQRLATLWLEQSLLTPHCALLCEALSPHTPPQRMLPPRRLSSARHLRQQQQLRQETPPGGTMPTVLAGQGVIGRAIEGDLWQWVQQGWLVYPQEALRVHAVMLGRSGIGKSETLRRIAFLAAACYHMKVIWIDGKGEWSDAARFLLTMQQAGLTRIGIFPTQAHHGWRGSRQDVLNLLMSCQTFSNEYYEGVTYNLLKMALYAPDLPPVTNSQELLTRLYPPQLETLYAGRPEYQQLKAYATDALWGPYGRYTAFFNGVQDRLDGTHGFGDWEAAYYLLDQKRLQNQVAPFARYLIDDFELYLALRQVQRKTQPVLLVLDDYSAYSEMVRVVDLFERIRSAGGCVIVSAQGYNGLGTDAERLLENAATTILHKCILPRKLVEVAGTCEAPALSFHASDTDEQEDETASTTIHMQQEARVQPNEVQQLGTGEAFFICNGLAQRVAVARLALDDDEAERLTTRLLHDYDTALASYEASAINAAPPALPMQQKRKGTSKTRKGAARSTATAPTPGSPGQPGASSSNASRKPSGQPISTPSANETQVTIRSLDELE